LRIEERAAIIKDVRKRMRTGESRAAIYADYADTAARKDAEKQLTRLAGSEARARYRYPSLVLVLGYLFFSATRLFAFGLRSDGIMSNPILKYGLVVVVLFLVPYLLLRYHKFAYGFSTIFLAFCAVRLISNVSDFQGRYGPVVPIISAVFLFALIGLSLYLAIVLFPKIPRDEMGRLLFKD
jgi:hypothetical protein